MVLADKEVMSTLISELNNAMDALNDIISEGEAEFMANRHLRGSAKYHLLVAIESVLDLSNHLITQNKWRLPENYADIFLVISENKVIKREEAEHLGEMARFRNRLIHQYWKIDDAIIWEVLVNDRLDITNYANKILDFVKTSVY